MDNWFKLVKVISKLIPNISVILISTYNRNREFVYMCVWEVHLMGVGGGTK